MSNLMKKKEKKRYYSIIILNLFLSFVIKSYCNKIGIYLKYTINCHGNSIFLNVLYHLSIIIYQNMSLNCLMYIYKEVNSNM